MNTWLDDLETMTAANPLARLPHVESFDRFKKRLKAIVQDALRQASKDVVARTYSVADVIVNDPPLTETQVRDGADDFSAIVIVRLRRGGAKGTGVTLFGRIPVPTSRGTLLHRSRTGTVEELVPVGQLLKRPGLHLSSMGDDLRKAVLIPDFGTPVEFTAALRKGRWTLRRPSRSGIARLHSFLSGPAARRDLNARLSRHSRSRTLTQEDAHAIGQLLCSIRFRPDEPADLERSRVILIGDYLERVFRRALLSAMSAPRSRSAPSDPALGTFNTEAFDQVEYAPREDRILGRFARAFNAGIERFLKVHCEHLSDTNPLDVLSALRKVTRCGPGGIREPKGKMLSLRDVHWSHYGRLCPVETPETERQGLTLFLATHATVGNDGQILTPLAAGRGTREVRCVDERKVLIAARGARPIVRVESGRPDRSIRTNDLERIGTGTLVRGSDPKATPSEVLKRVRRASRSMWRDVYAGQMLGPAAAMIPFIAHDDGARAMMGAKNMKQAVSLDEPEAPWIATGFERIAAEALGLVLRATRAGSVTVVGSNGISVTTRRGQDDVYDLPEPQVSQKQGWVRFRSRVRVGQSVERGQILAEGEAVRDGGLALGRNVVVAYMPWRGYNFEDAIVVSESMARAFATTHATEVRVPIFRDEAGEFIKRSGQDAQGRPVLDDSGVITVGAAVTCGTVLVRRRDHVHVATFGLEGTVVSVRRVELQPSDRWSRASAVAVIHVIVEQRRRLQLGDKLMGRHGNKGVVGRILPDDEMPHLGDGTRVDAVLNPHGVVSRMNVGQIIETHLGLLTWHERRRGRQVSYVVPPFAAVDTEELLRQMPKECPTGKAMLRDGKNGIPFECPVTVGIQYLLRLNHSPADKIAVRVPRLYNLFTQQAIRGRQLGGGQRFGEMESWALVTHDAPTLLRDIFTRRSDHLHANSAGCAVPETLRFVAIILRGIGVETEVQTGSKRWKPLADAPQSLGADTVRGLAFRWAADDEKRKWSRGEVTNSWPPFKSEKEEIARCRTCGRTVNLEKARAERRAAKSGSRRPFRMVCGAKGCKGKLAVQYVTRPTPRGFYDSQIFGERESADYRRDFGHLTLPVPLVHPWALAVLREFPAAPGLGRRWNDGLNPAVLARVAMGEDWVVTAIPKTENVIRAGAVVDAKVSAGLRGRKIAVATAGEALAYLEKRRMIALPKWVILRTLPVIPAAFRPWSDDRPFKLNTLYSHVLKAAQDVRSARTSIDARAAIKRRALETAVSRLIGFKARHQGSLSGMLGGKHGLLRQELLGRRVDQSARAVIVPAPHLALNSVELPAPIFDATAGQSLGGREDSLVLLNRAPSLHRYSIHASRPIRCDGQHVIGLHPLVCGGLNADFDGDTVAVHGVGQGAGVSEAESMLPGGHPLSVASGRFLLHMTQDIVSGLYLACGKDDLAEELRTLLPTHAWTSATRLRQRDLTEGLEALALKDPDRAVQNAVRLMQIGFEVATRHGLTLGLWDLSLSPSSIRGRARRLLQEAMTASDERSREVAQKAAWDSLAPPTTVGLSNPVAVMFQSGARGNAKQLGQLVGVRGFMSPANGSGVFSHFVASNLVEGHHPLEYFLCLHNTRRSMADKKLFTASAGELTRWLVEGCYDVAIVGDDCGVRDGRRVEVASAEEWRGLRGRVLAERRRYAAGEHAPGAWRRGDVIGDPLPTSHYPVELVLRSPLFCRADRGVCQRCYGHDPSTGRVPDIGLAVGVLAAQSIGERCTQLTMRTFHEGAAVGGGVGIDDARALFRGTDPDVVRSGHSADVFFARARQIYKSDVDARHLEVVWRQMRVSVEGENSAPSILAAARAGHRHPLARASFGDALQVLATAATTGRAAGLLRGHKERLLVGRDFRR